MRSHSILAALVLALGCAVPALAQDATPSVAKAECKKPQFPGRLASDNAKRAFTKDVSAYGDCIKKYVAAQQKVADEHNQIANNHIKAANQAAAEYNAAVKEIQDEIDAAKE